MTRWAETADGEAILAVAEGSAETNAHPVEDAPSTRAAADSIRAISDHLNLALRARSSTAASDLNSGS